MSSPALLLLAHGTNDAAGWATISRLHAAVARALPEVDVRLGYAGVVGPSLSDVLAGLPGPVVVVPAFLASGYHVRVDVPEQIAAIGRDDVVVAEPLGPDPELVGALLDRLTEAGSRPGDTVVLAAAGSTDPAAQEDLRTAAALLTARVGHEVPVGYIAGGEPRVASVVASASARGPRVVLATWLLAPGAFHRWLADAGATVVAEPLGDHPDVVAVVVDRYRAAAWSLAVHLYASDGRWIAWYRPGLPYLWSTRDRWIGWFPWSREPTPEPRDDVLDPADTYLGTVVGDRLLARVVRNPRAFPSRVPEPQRPVGPPDVDRAQAVAPPIGFVDVDTRRLFGD